MASSMHLYQDFRIYTCNGCSSRNLKVSGKAGRLLFNIRLSSRPLGSSVFNVKHRNLSHAPLRRSLQKCKAASVPQVGASISTLQSAVRSLQRSWSSLSTIPWILKLIPAVGVVIFAACGVVPLMRLATGAIFQQSDSSWKRSNVNYVTTSYVQPLLLWAGATLICRSLDSLIAPTLASQAVMQRLLTFVRSLSTVLASAYCLSSLIQLVQKKIVDTTNESNDARNMGFSFVGKAVYTAVWVAAISLFMELLGFSTQKWLTAGGLGTVLITLAGREILTNFLSSVMIHATRPFVVNEWIQTKIEGYEVSGTVEHVGWWSPTVIRGDDREAVHIPNHKFNVTVVRNLSQKTHWRIKTYFSISHLDVNKINSIVSDMRKVIAKNPQVEQQKLHRRVFLENIDPENQALNILISCFVKTSRFDEYLCVKEAILLDLLRVVSHHRARLATPIRTVQKVYNDSDFDPFADTVFTHARPPKSPYLLIEPSYKVSDVKSKSVSPNRLKGEGAATSAETRESSPTPDTNKNNTSVQTDPLSDDTSPTSTTEEVITDADSSANPRKGAARKRSSNNNAVSSLQTKQATEKSTALSLSARPAAEENIVLEVALEGSKRTLPMEDEISPSPTTAES